MKVLIVDDEVCTRIELKSIIDWQGNGYTLVGDANNGENALEQINLYTPDIVITDIKMPVMDGISLIRHCKEISTYPRFIVLSGYNDFHLVKEAMKLGADDYLLKLEINENILIKALQEARNNMGKHDNNETQNRSDIFSMDSQELIKEKRNSLLIQNVLCCENSQELYQSHGFFKDKSFCVLIVKNLDLHKVKKHAGKTKNELLASSMLSIIDEIIKDSFRGYCFELKSGEYCAVMWADESNESMFKNDLIMDIIERLTEMINIYFNINVFITFGGIFKNYEGLCKSYYGAIEKIEYQLKDENNAYYLALINKAKTYICEYYCKNIDLVNGNAKCRVFGNEMSEISAAK